MSAGEWIAFIADGGYERRELWTDAGWAWRVAEGARAPLYWERDGEGGWLARSFADTEPVDPRLPVCHVCAHEADAFARWAGCRLPTEAEWERAALGATVSVEAANLDQLAFGPAARGSFAPIGSGCRQMIGDVWEWTATAFGGYPGFRAFPYREYAEVFFGDGVPRAARRLVGHPAARRAHDLPQLGSARAPPDLQRAAARAGRGMTASLRPYRLDVHPLVEGGAGLAADARVGLTAPFKSLPPKHFYDERGSDLFERITQLPEYYQSRTEMRILSSIAAGVVERHRIGELVELGSGSSRKTRRAARRDARRPLAAPLRALRRVPGGDPRRRRTPARRVPGARRPRRGGRLRPPPAAASPDTTATGARLVAFLGGTIGNLEPESRAPFLASVAELMDDDDILLVGTDIAGDPARIQRAYDDAEGVTAQFNLNVLRVLNRELDADFDLDAFTHVALYDPGPPWIEMRLRAETAQEVHVGALDLDVSFAAGEEMRTEISCKFTRETVAEMYAAAGLELVEWHEDPRGWFAVSVARRI